MTSRGEEERIAHPSNDRAIGAEATAPLRRGGGRDGGAAHGLAA